jgi:DNA-binding NarL/FixJ family response regulator
MSGSYRILLADDHVLFRHELTKLISKTGRLSIVGEVGDGAELYRFLEKGSIDLVILDIYMPHLRAMEATRLIKLKYPETKVLIMIMDQEEEYLTQARCVGADGLLLKQYAAAELLKAIRTIQSGKFYLPVQFRENKPYIVASVQSKAGLQLCQGTSR